MSIGQWLSVPSAGICVAALVHKRSTSLRDMNVAPAVVLTSLDGLLVGVDHIAMAVDDLDRAIGVYSKTLGFTLIGREYTRGKSTAMLSAVLKAGKSTVVLVQGTSPDSQITRFRRKFPSRIHHVAYGVTDLDEAVRRLEKVGEQCETPIVSDDGLRQVFLRRNALTGVRVELVERRGKYFSASNAERLYRALESQNLC